MVDKGDRDLFTSAAALVGSDELDRRACQVELVEEQGRRTQARRSSMSAKLSRRSLTELLHKDSDSRVSRTPVRHPESGGDRERAMRCLSCLWCARTGRAAQRDQDRRPRAARFH